jgi:lysophospholipase L1-like esterase
MIPLILLAAVITTNLPLPEGNYDVTVTFATGTVTTVKSESRQLMLEKVAGGTHTFTVNIRTPSIAGGGKVSLKPREIGVPHWDDKLELEFLGENPSARSLQVTPTTNAITVYLAGDSTVTEQPKEPWAGWGQMLPRFFKQGVAVANHAESGLSLGTFRGSHRLEKVLSTMKAGDYLFIQFGHNDQKEKGEGVGPFSSYKTNLIEFVEAARKHGGIPVLVTPMERRRFNEAGKPYGTLAEFAEAVRQVGAEENVPVIDLNAMSLKFYEALGPENSKKAFVHYPAGTYPGQDKELKDDTHHNAYGGYELAKCVVEGIKANVPELAKHLRNDTPPFDPSQPDPPEAFDLPASPVVVSEKPEGN